jgi:hypothetical protein
MIKLQIKPDFTNDKNAEPEETVEIVYAIKAGVPTQMLKSLLILVRCVGQQEHAAGVPLPNIMKPNASSVVFKYLSYLKLGRKKKYIRKVACIYNGRHIDFKENVCAVIYIK